MESEYAEHTQVSNLCSKLSFEEKEVIQLYQTLSQKSPFQAPPGQLSIAFVSIDEISRLHGQFMDDPTPTDVITFPGDSDFNEAGEICVCPEVAYEYAKANNGDFSRELTLYLAHGYLHLAGLDDIEDNDREKMREAESIVMAIIIESRSIPNFKFPT
ncbi:rRNA maturation RNase YbeY [Puniceicoccaceae bacterium K14]|nr:rRNA maturation RNase YbeY [Puniceicoccaceae bacterium K14]